LLSRTTAIAVLEVALKQMHVCALLHNNVNDLTPTSTPAQQRESPLIHQRAFFAGWPYQPEQLPAAFLMPARVVDRGRHTYRVVQPVLCRKSDPRP
jgi:hypothetical protein